MARLPSGATAKPVWLWWSTGIDDDLAPDPDAALVDLLWQAFLRRFDIEHTFRLLKQTLGWTVPKLHDPSAADRWTWLRIAAHIHCGWPDRPEFKDQVRATALAVFTKDQATA